MAIDELCIKESSLFFLFFLFYVANYYIISILINQLVDFMGGLSAEQCVSTSFVEPVFHVFKTSALGVER